MSYGQGIKLQYCPIGGNLNFILVWSRKNAKTGGFSLSAHFLKFAQRRKIPGQNHEKATSRAFRKCETYWACQVLKWSYCCSKSEDCQILGKIRRSKKTVILRYRSFWSSTYKQKHCTMGEAQCKMGNRKTSTSTLILRGTVTFTF